MYVYVCVCEFKMYGFEKNNSVWILDAMGLTSEW